MTALVDGTTGSGTLGQVVERYVYDPYGRDTVTDGSWTARTASLFGNTIRFAGYRLDPSTALYHVRHRVYHPTWAAGSNATRRDTSTG